jgi:predicted Rossmann fold flavoprotein
LATGGKSYPLMGSDGAGYKLAEKLGHTIVEPLPALAPIKIKEPWVSELRGISLQDIRITLLLDNKKILTEEGQLVFTHFGVSGPAILNISSTVAQLLLNKKPTISLDLFPWLNAEELYNGLEEEIKKNIAKSIKNIISIFMAEKMAEKILEVNNIDKDKVANNMSKAEKQEIAKLLKNIVITPEEVLGFDLAKTTKGGILLKEIDHKTMKSKIINNLSFAGEIIDVDGKTGGFNLQMCWSTGYLAGNSL